MLLRKCPHRALSSIESGTETEYVPLKPQGVVEGMGIGTSQPARKRQLVTPGFVALLACMLHHRSPDAAALMLRGDGDILHDAGAPPMLGEIVHDEQLIGANHLAFKDGRKDAVARVSREYGEVLLSFLGREGRFGFDARAPVKSKDLRDVAGGCFADH